MNHVQLHERGELLDNFFPLNVYEYKAVWWLFVRDFSCLSSHQSVSFKSAKEERILFKQQKND